MKRSDGRRAGIYGIGTSAVGAPLYVVGKVVAEVSPTREAAAGRCVTATMFTDALITAATVFMLMLLCLLLGAPPLRRGARRSLVRPRELRVPARAHAVHRAGHRVVRDRGGVLRDPCRRARGARVDLLACGACAGAALLFRVSAALFVPMIGLWLLVAAWRSRDAAVRISGAGSGACSSSARGSPRARSARCC